MEELKSDYHDANSFPLNDLDQTTSTTNLSQEKKQRTPLKPVVQHYTKKQQNNKNPWNYLAQQRKYQTSKLFGTTLMETANMNITEMGLKILEKTVKKAY